MKPLQEVNTISPVVIDPNIQIDQLIDELHNPVWFDATGSEEGTSLAHDVLYQLKLEPKLK